jgi:hypothetical protein
MATRYLYNLHIGTAIDAAVRLNGVTVRKGTSDSQDGISGAADHLLQPGRNEIEVEIFSADRTTGTAYILARVLRTVEQDTLAEIDWRSTDPGPLPPSPPFPILRTATFELPEDHPPPPWDGAAVEEMPADGTPEAWRPVRELHGGMTRGDEAAVQSSLAPRAAEYHRIHGTPEAAPGPSRQIISQMMVGPYEMAPIGPADLEFRQVAGGRAVQVLRRGPGSAIAGHAVGAPKIAYVSDPLLVRRDGLWQIVG